VTDPSCPPHPSLTEVFNLCAEARWHSLHGCAGLPNTVGSFGPCSSADLAAAVVERSWQRLHRHDSSATPHLDRLPREPRLWLEIGFRHLALAEERILLEMEAEARGHAMAFLQSLRSAALLLEPESDRGLPAFTVRHAEVLLVRLRAQLRLARSLQAGRVAERMIFVLGMHRSGTSALAGMLCVAGYDAPKDQMPADDNNPKGYWESMGLYGFNDELLETLGSSWQGCEPLPNGWEDGEPAARWRDRLLEHFAEVFADSSCPVIKDPRFCILLPGLAPWLDSDLLQCSVLIPVRHPLEVASSLQTRDGLAIPAGIQLWLAHLFSAERFTRRYRRCLISFEELLAQPAVVLQQVIALVGSGEGDGSADASGFVEQGLRHQDVRALAQDGGPLPATARTALTIAESLYQVLTNLDHDERARWAIVDRLHSHWLTLPLSQLLLSSAQPETEARSGDSEAASVAVLS